MVSHTEFWAEYEGVERLDLGHGFWVEIKRSLTEEDAAACDEALVDRRFSQEGGRVVTEMHLTAYRRELVFRSIVNWNLLGRNGQPMPLSRQSVSQLPRPVFNRILARVQELNAERPADQEGRFPAADLGGVGARGGGAAGPATLPDGEGAVAAPRAPVVRGSPPAPAAAPGLPGDPGVGGSARAQDPGGGAPQTGTQDNQVSLEVLNG